jgi:hypothetical protein
VRGILAACLFPIGLLHGCAAKTVEPAGAASFEAIAMKSSRESHTPEAIRWEQENAPKMGPAMDEVSSACSAEEAGGARPEFTLLVRLDAAGSVKQVLVSPKTPYTECVRSGMTGVKFPGAPWEGYWLTIQMRQ